MGRVVIELTNRCNLRCQHCFTGRHGGNEELDLALLDTLLAGARDAGFDELAFTGGEPSTHRRFAEVIARTAAAGYRFGLVSNGWNFPKIYSCLLGARPQFQGVTFSLDGARQVTHDRLRGAGSYRRLLQAMSICVARDIPFSINTVITRHSLSELEELLILAAALGSSGVRFGHYLENGRPEDGDLVLSPAQREAADACIAKLRTAASISVVQAPGAWTQDLFPCAPLNLAECNVDWRGNVSTCCHLSGAQRNGIAPDTVGNLRDMGMIDAAERLRARIRTLREHKQYLHKAERMAHEDYLPCHYCRRYHHERSGSQRIAVAAIAAGSGQALGSKD